ATLPLSNLCAKNVTFNWFGQACFLVVTSNNTKIILDPIKFGRYRVPPEIVPDLVTVSHEHMDHNKVDSLTGSPVVVRGLTASADDFAKIDRKVKDIKIYTVPTYHDTSQGAERGLNAVFVLEFDGLRLVHLGDLGHTLSEKQIKRIGKVDILMIPVGGKYTIWGDDAHRVVDQLKPKMIVFPMHFKTRAASFLPYSAEDFVAGKNNVVRVQGNRYDLDLAHPPKKMQYVVLDYK
ncbi:MAG: MBL fold metallo-hydrolase, partial [Deltaproteobacteria bacterium]|nr:MBL fold metallo-hydrolase [Deltaproteobacteria bacterium]